MDETYNSCHEVPDTVANCSEFLSMTECKYCVTPYFLRENHCVKSDRIIYKCRVYKDDAKCEECEGANLLSEDGTLCLKFTESSCETYLNPANCKTCSGNKVINYIDDSNGSIVSGLNGEDLTTRRAICKDSGITGCAIARRSHPTNTCVECDPNHFKASSSSCDRVTQPIDNCDKYFQDGVCSECSDNHILSLDKKECLYSVSFLGDNCQSGKFFSEPKCLWCRKGHYFDENHRCAPCAMKGCAVCPGSAPASCRLCAQGYFMDSSRQCLENGTKAASTEETEGSSGDTFGLFSSLSGSVEMLRIVVGVLLVFTFTGLV